MPQELLEKSVQTTTLALVWKLHKSVHQQATKASFKINSKETFMTLLTTISPQNHNNSVTKPNKLKNKIITKESLFLSPSKLA